MTRRAAAAVGAAIAVLFLAVSCVAPAPAADPPAAAARDADGADALADRVIARINLHRARQGLGPLRADAALARAALAHSRDMADNDFFAHTGPDGSAIGARARGAGYAWRRIGENIAGGASSPEEVVDDWMASEGHRLNMLEADYVHAGVGHVLRDPDPGRVRYRHYWTLMLGAPAAP